ncbi:hypothetical protein, partial [Actinomyces ruminis]|uniref:hypothetical protein n=1 Tax=Actinomyces ruminis TaxID=1937003 RepID=UPI001C5585E7
MEATATSPASSTPVSESDHRPVRGARCRAVVVVVVLVLVVVGVAGGVWWRVWVEDPLETQ